MSQRFRLKQFSLSDDGCGHKIGTDAILLGSWAGQSDAASQILDVGTGCGIIALMMAQRFPEAHLTAVEFEQTAARRARENFQQSPWGERMRLMEADIRTLSADPVYDVITCNPPFFCSSLRPAEPKRQQARHNHTLSLTELASFAATALGPEGRLAIVLPVQREADMIQAGRAFLLQLARRRLVRPTPGQEANRVLLELNRIGRCRQEPDVILEDQRHQYSDSYTALAHEFLLKMPAVE